MQDWAQLPGDVQAAEPEVWPAKSPAEHVSAFLATSEAERTKAALANARFYHRMIRGKSYDGPGIVDGINDSETLDEVDEIVRLAVREAVADRKTVQRWLVVAALRKLALCKERREIFDVTIQARTPLTLRDGRRIELRTLQAAIVTAAANRRLGELDAPAQQQRSVLVDGHGQPLQASA